jgi:hypothetical protein
MRISLSLVVVIALAIVTGCVKQKRGTVDDASQKRGTADDASQKSVKKITFDPKNTCALLKKEEVEVLMKQKLMNLEPYEGFCNYWSQKPKYISFEITVRIPDDPRGDLKGMKELMQKDASKHGHVIKQVDGIGDGAFFQVIPRENETYIHVVKGKYYFVFRSRGDKGYELSEDAVKGLVKTVLGRI